MVNLLVTGALGTVGRRVVQELLRRGHHVTALDRLRPMRGIRRRFAQAVRGRDAVIHLAAVIPPRADREPDLAYRVNVEGTETLVHAMEAEVPAARLVYASSIAVYGDRVQRPLITEGDDPAPNPKDAYGNQKLAAERIIRTSTLRWTILRLSYVVATDALVMDPLLFDMPPETAVEPCDVSDVARALCAAATKSAAVPEVNAAPQDHAVDGQTFLIAGGAGWRIMYRDYLALMFRAFGLGANFLPNAAFGREPFHCAFMDTSRSQAVLRYQVHTFASFVRRVHRQHRVTRILVTTVRPLARAYLLSRSPHFRAYLRGRARGELGRFLLRLRVCLGIGLSGDAR
jgi:nucleoside-diphosphate-sugar epimerase